MSAKLFPAGLMIDLPGLDLEMMRFYTNKWNIAYQYGYFNQSSFCSAYKKMFGELPSHTLQRGFK